MQTYLITGVTSDIGLSVVEKVLEVGDRVIGVYRVLGDHLRELKERYPEGLELVQVDFLDQDRLGWFLKEIESRYPDVDSLISLAALRDETPYSDVSRSSLLQHFEVNVVAPFLITQAVVERMRARRWGRILIGSSIGVKFGGGASTLPYSLTKYCAEFIPSAARNWAADNVLYNVLRIGFTDTSSMRAQGAELFGAREALIPMGRSAKVEEITKTIVWLTTDENTYIAMQVIPVSGGE